MYDRFTEEVIAASPGLSGVIPADLARELTDAYIRVAIARTTLASEAEGDSETINRLIEDLRTVASAYETIALTTDDPATRQSSAFVAASSYFVIGKAQRRGGTDAPEGLLGTEEIHPMLSAALLFLVADATADAIEAAAEIDHSVDKTIRGACVQGIRLLCANDLTGVSNMVIETQIDSSWDEPNTLAADAGYRLLLLAVIEMAQALMKVDRAGWIPGRFKDLLGQFSIQVEVASPVGDSTLSVEIALPGPWHLGTLLNLAESVLVVSAVSAIVPPPGIEQDSWTVLLERLARRRPLLWRNHRSAVDEGLLGKGVSAVVAYPTGAGKSTIAELKIAGAVLNGQDVVYLVPTIALLDQVARSLRDLLPNEQVLARRELDEVLEGDELGTARIFVMTPESCLASLEGADDTFASVGLIVFDEAHLLHSEEGASGRRALDAMLCLLTLITSAENPDVLLISAMISNAGELADWLASILGRQTLALDTLWKPTRQARAAVVYVAEDITAIREGVQVAYQESVTKRPNVVAKKLATAIPYGFFGLRSTWASTHIEDYALLKLLSEPVPLAVSGTRPEGWYLTANANKVSTAVASAAGRGGTKVLVFCQQVDWAVSVARDVGVNLPGEVKLNSKEKLLLGRTVEQLGTSDALYLDLDGETLVSLAVPHHGLLLPEERRLHESLYKRADGASVMAATSTVAQGMNFPSEIVVIAGDRRFDPHSDRMERLQAHELLNAAGRAGRAGQRANGLVVVVPSSVVHYDRDEQRMERSWFALQAVFAQSDQCVAIVDPIEGVLDAIQSGVQSDNSEYFLRRMGGELGSARASRIVGASFAAFHARKRDEETWLSTRVEALESALGEADSLSDWAVELSAVTGVDGFTLNAIASALSDSPSAATDVDPWISWYLDFLGREPEVLLRSLRVGSRAVFKGAEQELGAWDLDASTLVLEVAKQLRKWVAGATLLELETAAVNQGLTKGSPQLTTARKFVLRVIPDLAYLFGLPAIVHKRAVPSIDWQNSVLDSLADCVEEGVDTLAKLEALRSSPTVTRRAVHDLTWGG